MLGVALLFLPLFYFMPTIYWNLSAESKAEKIVKLVGFDAYELDKISRKLTVYVKGQTWEKMSVKKHGQKGSFLVQSAFKAGFKGVKLLSLKNRLYGYDAFKDGEPYFILTGIKNGRMKKASELSQSYRSGRAKGLNEFKEILSEKSGRSSSRSVSSQQTQALQELGIENDL